MYFQRFNIEVLYLENVKKGKFLEKQNDILKSLPMSQIVPSTTTAY